MNFWYFSLWEAEWEDWFHFLSNFPKYCLTSWPDACSLTIDCIIYLCLHLGATWIFESVWFGYALLSGRYGHRMSLSVTNRKMFGLPTAFFLCVFIKNLWFIKWSITWNFFFASYDLFSAIPPAFVTDCTCEILHRIEST